jgi:CHAT domain-containing protein
MREHWPLAAYAVWALFLGGPCLTHAMAEDQGPPVDVRLVNDLYRAGQYRQAVEVLDQLLEPRKAAKLSVPASISCLNLAVEVNQASGRFDAALRCALQQQQLQDHQFDGVPAKQNTYRQTMALTIADLQMSLDEFKEAEKTLRGALAIPAGARLDDPLWEANAQVQLARAVAAPALADRQEVAQQQAAKQWTVAENCARHIVDHYLSGHMTVQQLVQAAKLQEECLLALGRADEAAGLIDRLLQSGSPELDDLARMDLSNELARCRHAEGNFAAERTVLEQALSWQQNVDHNEPTVAQAALLNRLAVVLQTLGADTLAEDRWKSAANLYRQLLDPAAKGTLHTATKPEVKFLDLQCLQGLQEIDMRLGNWPDGVSISQDLLQRLEPRLRADDPAFIRAKTMLGAFLAKNEDWNAARPILEEAAAYWRTRVPLAPADLAGTLVNLAEIARQTGSFTQAQSLLEEALLSYRAVLSSHDVKLADALSNLAAVQNARGQFHEALTNYLEVESICRDPANIDDRRSEELHSTALLNLSMLYKSQRQFDSAAATCEQALALVQKRHPSDTDIALLPFHIALASLYLAEDISPLDESMVSVSSETNANFQSMSQNRGLNAALQRADFHIQSALSLCTQHGLLQKPTGANLLHLTATLQYRRGELKAAKESWHSALQIAQLNGQTAIAFRCLSYLSQLAVKESNFDEAETLSRSAVELQEVIQAYPAMHYMALVNRAQILRKLGRKEDALNCLHEAVRVIESPRAETTGGEAQRAVYFAQFAAAFDLLVDWSVEENHWDDALSYAEAGRNRTFLDQVRAAGIDLKASLRNTPQEHLIDDEQTILSQYHALQASAIEWLVSNGPSDAVANSATGASVNETNTTRKNSSGKIADLSAELAGRLADLRRQYADIQTAIRDASPFYRELLLGNRELQAWPVVKSHVLSSDSVILLYYLGQTGGHLFLIDGNVASRNSAAVDTSSDAGGDSNRNATFSSSQEVTHYPLVVSAEQSSRLGIPAGPLSRQAAAQLVFRFVATLCEPEHARNSSRELGQKAVTSAKYAIGPSEELMITDIFVPPALREELRRRSPRYIALVPDGALHQLPMEALRVSIDPPRYLLDELPPIAYAPSAMILAALGQRKSVESVKDFSLLTVGNPRYPEIDPAISRSSSDVALADYIAAGGTLSPLPGTSSECRKVAASLRSAGLKDVITLEDLNASERNVRTHLAGRQFVHLAAHGLVDQQYQNLFGALALTQPDNFQNVTTENDGFLSLFEIHNLPLDSCELVVLSACQTNIGPDRPLEAGSTMARAFLAAGARRVVCSQWDVDDESTSELIGSFAAALGESLRAGQTPNYAVALAEAKKYVRAQSKWSSPYFWAPFVLMGPAK